jgi:hypothetical protein
MLNIWSFKIFFMETGLVKTASFTAAPAALPRPRGTVRAVGLFSQVTTRPAEVPARWGSDNAPGCFSIPAGGNIPGSASGNILGSVGSHASGNPAAMSHLAGAATPWASADSLQAPASFRDADRGSRHAEYLLVIYPGGELEEKILEEQKQFSVDYAVAVRNKPHLTVATFQAGEMMEETLIRWLQRICTQYQSFDLMLNNYSGFPPHTTEPAELARPAGQSLEVGPERANFSGERVRGTIRPAERVPGTIYLRVQDPQPFKHLMQQLASIDEFIRSSGCPPVKLISRPFLSIAGGLTEQVYNRAMPDYSRRTFHDTFRVRELVLLKRTHSFDPCKTVNIFRLRAE